ncbi:hypothetical protein ACJMK2_026382 [Sinanodonta woodiana]|uniref:Uncharacterized protein n=1 Tax=Sinanodonta woodiana TaxID=1069815 RepID=A0ABD3XJE9_SINWO
MASSIGFGLTDPETGTVIPVACQPNSNIPTISQIQPAIVNVPMQRNNSRTFADIHDRSFRVVVNGNINYIVHIGNGIQESSDDRPSLQELGVTERLNV